VNPKLKQLRVLVVDDAKAMRDLIRNVLLMAGVGEVATAVDGAKAIEIVLQTRPHLIYVDWEMHGMSGVDFVRAIRSSSEGDVRFTPIIMVTAHAEQSAVLEARQAGIHEYLLKPFTARSVLARLVSVINNPRDFVRRDGFFGPAPRTPAAG
jgi:CheY-like chemotaxis protein